MAAINRRNFLKIGGLTLGGLTLPGLLAARADSKHLVNDKSVIFLFMAGAPSQIELFDNVKQHPTMPWTRRPGYSSTSASAHATTIASVTSMGT